MSHPCIGPAFWAALPGLGAAMGPWVLVAYTTRHDEAGFLFGCIATLGWLAVLLRSPRRIEVRGDRVLVSFWLGWPVELGASQLEIQRLPTELTFVTPQQAVGVRADQLSLDELETLHRDASSIAARVVVVTARAVEPPPGATAAGRGGPHRRRRLFT